MLKNFLISCAAVLGILIFMPDSTHAAEPKKFSFTTDEWKIIQDDYNRAKYPYYWTGYVVRPTTGNLEEIVAVSTKPFTAGIDSSWLSLTNKVGENYNSSDWQWWYKNEHGNFQTGVSSDWRMRFTAVSYSGSDRAGNPPFLLTEEVKKIPTTMFRTLTAGGLLSAGLIVLASLLVVGLVPRLRNWFFR